MSGRRQIDDDADALRVLVREAHEVIKDLRAVIRETKTVVNEVDERVDIMQGLIPLLVGDRVNAEVERQLQQLSETMKGAIAEAEAGIYDRFDAMSGILMGEQDNDLPVLEQTTMEDQARLLRAVVRGTPRELLDAHSQAIIRGLVERSTVLRKEKG